MSSYHDFVIKDGKFIGKFDEMYSKYDDPWMQSSQPNKYGRQIAIMNIKRFNIKSVIEFGSGLGYYSDWIHKETGILTLGVDISEIAVNKAKNLFPNLNFTTGNVKNLEQFSIEYDAILFAEITWYILDDLKFIFENLYKKYKGKYFIHNLCFYKNDKQKYGREYFTSLKQFIDFCPFKLIGYGEATTDLDDNIDSTSIFKIEIK